MNESIKRKWLFSFYIILLATCLSAAISTNIIPKAMTFALALLGCITYYFGYKKKGTKWLSFIISIRIFGILSFFAQIIYYLYTAQLFTILDTISQLTSVSANTYGIIALSGMLVSIYYTYWCYRLRKSNKLQNNVA